MKKSIYLSALCVLAAASVSVAQKQKSKSIDVRYLSVPSNDVSSFDPSTLTAEFAAGELQVGAEKLKDTESTCVPKGGGLKDAIKIKTYYYQMPVTAPESFVVVKDAAGNPVYASQLSQVGAGDPLKFGFDKCEYWVVDKMKKDFASGKAGFISQANSTFAGARQAEASQQVNSSLFLAYFTETVNVNTGKGKAHDYSDLDGAYEKALSTYKNLDKTGPNSADFESLKECIAIWEKALEEKSIEDKDARISKPVARGLHENIAVASMFIYDMEKASSHTRSAAALWGNFTNNRTTHWNNFAMRLLRRKDGVAKNASLVSDPDALRAKADASKGNSINIQRAGAGEVVRLKKEYGDYVRINQGATIAAAQEDHEQAVERGEANQYDMYCTDVAGGGKSLSMTAAAMKLLGQDIPEAFPAEIFDIENLSHATVTGFGYTEVPADIGKAKNLKRLFLGKNKLTTLPPEIGQCSELQVLNLANNPITELPEEIKNCENLKTLNLKGTKLGAEAKANLARWCPDAKVKY